jgi:hypothetical protein
MIHYYEETILSVYVNISYLKENDCHSPVFSIVVSFVGMEDMAQHITTMSKLELINIIVVYMF